MSEESWHEVQIVFQQYGTTKVKGKSQRDAEEKLRQFCEIYTSSSNDEKILLQELPIALNSLEYSSIEIVDGEILQIQNSEDIQELYNEVKKSESESKLEDLMGKYPQLTKESCEEIKEPEKKDLSNPNSFLSLSKNFK